MKLVKLFFLLSFGAILPLTQIQAQVTIVVNKGMFESVEKAAVSETKIKWSGADLVSERACTECFAAKELAQFLAKSGYGAEKDFRFAQPEAIPGNGDVFIIGSRKSNPVIKKLMPENKGEPESDQSFRIFSKVVDNRQITIIEGGDRSGTLYGVYSFLELLGFRFFGLGETGIVFPDQPVELPPSLDIFESPSFITRGFKGLENRGDQEIILWMARNKLNYTEISGKDHAFRKKLGLILMGGEHDIQLQISPHNEYPYNHPSFKGDEHKTRDIYKVSKEYMGDADNNGVLTYFEAHPEWYGLRNGKRSNNIGTYHNGDNFCTSNADARSELAKNIVQSLADGIWSRVDILNLWMFDNGKWCECDNCEKQGNLSERLLDVAYSVQKALQTAKREKRINRRVMLTTLAYHETLPPPQKPLPADFDYENIFVTYFPIERCYVHSLADPACTEFNSFLINNYKSWMFDVKCSYKGDMAIGEYFNVSRFKSLPIVYPTIMAADIPWYHKTGTRHFHYMHTPTQIWGTWTLNQYLYGKLTWNIEVSVNQILDDFFDRYYPSTQETTRQFYKHLETTFSNFKPLKHYAGKDIYNLRGRLAHETLELFPHDHLKYDEHHPVINDGLDVMEMVREIQLARNFLDRSLISCENPVERSRLIEDDKRFVYGEAMLFFYYHLIRTAMLHRRSEKELARNEFDKAEKFAEQLRNIVDVVAPPNDDKFVLGANATNGFEASQVEHVFNYFKQRYGN